MRRDAYLSVFNDLFKGLAHYTSKGELEFIPKTEEQKSAADPTAPIERPKVVLKGTEQWELLKCISGVFNESCETRGDVCLFSEIRKDPFDILPEGWICVSHNSGIPIYLHKQLRVVSVTRPYFLGKGSVRVSHASVLLGMRGAGARSGNTCVMKL